MTRKICVITGSRAEYGSLSCLMRKIQEDQELDLHVVVTGSHLSPEFGLTYKEIEKDGFIINKKVEMILSADTSTAITKSTGLGIISFADVFSDLLPDLVVIVGDRYEVFAASFASLIAGIPIAHVSGGEISMGAFDEAIRHSITKMSYLHFTITEEFRQRVIQLGEEPNRVFNTGSLGVDAILNTEFLTKEELEERLEFKFLEKNIIITFHPVTLEKGTAEKQFDEVLKAISSLEKTRIIFTFSNSDTDGRIILDKINSFVQRYSTTSVAFASMGSLNYFSTLQYVDIVLGNSSSGLSEAPSFKIATVNIGDRQKGRLKLESVIDCAPEKNSILSAIRKAYSEEFRDTLKNVKSPFGDGQAAEKITKIIKTVDLPKELKKSFHDL